MSFKIPSVLSFQRGTIVTDGVMSSIIPGPQSGTETLQPVRVIRHGIRGVLSQKDKDSASNVQRTESAKTSMNAIGLDVTFSFRTIPATELLFGCSDMSYREAVAGFIDRFFKVGVPEFDEVCRRYARNILNGRWLWRNRVLGSPQVTVRNKDIAYVSGEEVGMRFENYTDHEIALARDVIAAGLLNWNAPVTVHGRILFGFAGEVEVFPSQNMVTDKPDGFARSLYKIEMLSRQDFLSIMGSARNDAGDFAADMIDMGVAALRDQKIGNAIRTIDTWHSAGKPIPVEPNGANLEDNMLYHTDDGMDVKKLLSEIDEIKPGPVFDPRAAYLIALFVRGGVFSEKAEGDNASKKSRSKKTEKADKETAEG